MELRRWDNKEIIFELECNSWEELLKGALKAKVSFYRANFRGANFRILTLEVLTLVVLTLNM
jgi:hypothetical protein